MIANGKYKISNLAKDLGLKNKDITDICAKIGITGKIHSSPVEIEEFEMILDYLTKDNQMIDLNGYVMGGYDIRDDRSRNNKNYAPQARVRIKIIAQSEKDVGTHFNRRESVYDQTRAQKSYKCIRSK